MSIYSDRRKTHARGEVVRALLTPIAAIGVLLIFGAFVKLCGF